ncbi:MULTISPECIES: hypothetical protein [Acidithiobacillus]|uniref:Uncharacterized protein n=1 Tax=Acidithiobacillus sulfurivorans TaxID=1958756 RepID=A0ABS6A1Z2_9PROT|nr:MULTISPECIES: hypothetical protein [Acidithiobacillus]MBU2741855.1 hypothetical protein [Acidithiobacillus albertensis]MBU2760939.1 hypothetical protein [Acidithiobacillus sulfurivorans]
MGTIKATSKNKENKRVKAWQNFMTRVVNEGVSSGFIKLDEHEAEDVDTIKEYEFLLNKHLVRVLTREIAYGELSIIAAMCMNEEICDEHNVAALNIGRHKQCIATARGWLERKTGQYIQDIGSFQCRDEYVDRLADMNVKPLGFAKSGPFMR